ncbi:hypothetical protein [Streptomyces flaveus]|uniref:hypothetical protein n=1 Tax=Streptomyces flaveus TaxID=66370 RepID=UPI00331D97F0
MEDTGIWPVTWPVRLWIVEPVGDTGNWGQRYYPYRLLAHQIRIVEETDAWQALGRNVREVLDVIEHQIPERAARWAADWDAAPEGMANRCWNWHLCGGRNSGSGMWVQSVIGATARARRESAAQRWSQRLAGDTVDKILAASGASPRAVTYARGRSPVHRGRGRVAERPERTARPGPQSEGRRVQGQVRCGAPTRRCQHRPGGALEQ